MRRAIHSRDRPVYTPVRVTTAERHRLETAFAASAMVHLVAALWLSAHHMAPLPGVRPQPRLIPVSLLGRPGGGGGARGPEPASPPQVAAPVPMPPVVAPTPTPQATRARPTRPAVASRPPATAAPATGIPVPSATTDGGGTATGGEAQGGDGAGGGDGTGGDGTGGARVAYGSNPKPPYPVAALRMRLEGTVLLEVSVAPDGRPSAVRLQHSSGHAALDDSAMTTVRDRWRFVPARAGGVAVEGTVQVPIRFRLTDDE